MIDFKFYLPGLECGDGSCKNINKLSQKRFEISEESCMKNMSVMLIEGLFLEEVQVASYLSWKHGKLSCVVIIIPLSTAMESKLPDQLA